MPIPVKVLDVGAGSGEDLLNIKDRLSSKRVSLYAVETYPPYIEVLRKNGIEVASINIERESLPFSDNSFDLIVVNQVMEHVKEIFWIISELRRVLKPGGRLIIGVPNLASLHHGHHTRN